MTKVELTKEEYSTKLELILIIHGNNILDFRDGKTSLSIGELLELTLDSIKLLNEEAIKHSYKPSLPKDFVNAGRNQLRQELKEIMGSK